MARRYVLKYGTFSKRDHVGNLNTRDIRNDTYVTLYRIVVYT